MPKGDDPVVMYPSSSYRYSGADTWSTFDARLAEKVVNSQGLFTIHAARRKIATGVMMGTRHVLRSIVDQLPLNGKAIGK